MEQKNWQKLATRERISGVIICFGGCCVVVVVAVGKRKSAIHTQKSLHSRGLTTERVRTGEPIVTSQVDEWVWRA